MVVLTSMDDRNGRHPRMSTSPIPQGVSAIPESVSIELRLLRLAASGADVLLSAPDIPSLFNEFCTTAAKAGGYKLAWIGEVQALPETALRLVSMAGGPKAYVDRAILSDPETEASADPTLRAITTGKVQIHRDGGAPIPPESGAGKAGLKASISIPLTLGKGVTSAVSFYSAAADAFDAAEAAVLLKLADNLAAQVTRLQALADIRATEVERSIHAAIVSAIESVLPNGIMLVDGTGRTVAFNKGFLEVWGIAESSVRDRTLSELFPVISQRVSNPTDYLMKTNEIFGHATGPSYDEIPLTDGRILDRYTAPVFKLDGTSLGRVAFVQDITLQKRSELSLRRLNRVLLALIRQSEALVSNLTETAIMREICRCLVEVGGYGLAWIGIPKPGTAGRLDAFGAVGDRGQDITTIIENWNSGEPRLGIMSAASTSGTIQVVRDFQEEARTSAIHRRIAEENGFAAGAAMPLDSHNGVYAVLMMFSRQKDSFDEDELSILKIMADNLVKGIRAIRVAEDREAAVARWRNGMISTITTLSGTMEMRDPYTAGHQSRVGALSAAIATELKLPEEQVQGIFLAGQIHDIGKITVPAEILTRPGALSALELELIRTHPMAGYNLLKDLDFPWPIAKAVLQHHERLDGSGYPDKRLGPDIVLDAKILAVADVVESMTSHRPYRPAIGLDKALAEVEAGKGNLYDTAVVEACVKLFRENRFAFPVHTMSPITTPGVTL